MRLISKYMDGGEGWEGLKGEGGEEIRLLSLYSIKT